MNGQIERPKCKHTLELGEVKIVESKMADLRCSFCYVEELEAKLRALVYATASRNAEPHSFLIFERALSEARKLVDEIEARSGRG